MTETEKNKLDLQALRAASGAARERVQQWPAWKREAVRAVSAVASSPQTQQVLSEAQSSGSQRPGLSTNGKKGTE